MKSNNRQYKIEFYYFVACKMLVKQHNFTNELYNIQRMNDLLFNEKSHLVSMFKDNLIYDDLSEFFKRFYKQKKSKKKLERILDYYERSSRVFPNYTVLSESKYIYKNIQKKQKVIDEIQQIDEENKDKQIKASRNTQYKESKLTEIFNTEAFELINEPTKSDYIGFDLFINNVNNNQFIEDQEINLIEKIVNKITNEEQKQISRLKITTDLIPNSNKNHKNVKKQFSNIKNILIAQKYKFRTSFLNNKNENKSLNTSYKKICIQSTQSNPITYLNNNSILKSCVFSLHQKQISSLCSMQSQNSNYNSQNASKLFNTHYIKTESSLSPKKKFFLTSNHIGINNKFKTTIRHSHFKNKIANQESIKLNPQPLSNQIRSKTKIESHLGTGALSVTCKLVIPIINNKSPIKGIHIKNFDDGYQQNKTVHTLPQENFQNSSTSRNKYNLKSERHEPKYHLSWKRLKKL